MTKDYKFMKYILGLIVRILVIGIGLIGVMNHELLIEYLGVYEYVLAFFLWIVLFVLCVSSSKEES